MNKEFLFDMLSTASPSGDEFTLQKKVMEYTQTFADIVDAVTVYKCGLNYM